LWQENVQKQWKSNEISAWFLKGQFIWKSKGMNK